MVVLREEECYARFFVEGRGSEVEVAGEVEKGVDLAAGDEGLPSRAWRVAVDAC